VGLRDSAAEYCEMASSCCRASIAISPRVSSFSQQRDSKSVREWSRRCRLYCIHDHSRKIHLACSPSSSCPSSLAISWKHSIASVTRLTASRCSHKARKIENLGTLNLNSKCQFHTTCQWRGTLTPLAVVKTFFHNPSVNFTLTHSINTLSWFHADNGSSVIT
jgi:hypothetical protein